jgi:ASPIC/UnbV protein/VCBS repeat protein
MKSTRLFVFALLLAVAGGLPATPPDGRGNPPPGKPGDPQAQPESLIIIDDPPDPGGGSAPLTPWFTNVTSEAALGSLPAFRLSVVDVNNDGYPDVLAHLQQNEVTGDVLNKQLLYLNTPLHDPSNPFRRRFIDYTAASGIRANRQGTNTGRESDAGIFGDVDNDGDVDLFTGVYVQDSVNRTDYGRNDLMLNDGHAHFTLAPNSPFHTETRWNTGGEVFAEVNNDGNLDLFIGNWYRPTPTLTADQLYLGAGNGSFTNVTASSGIGSIPTAVYAVAAFDSNGDGFTDLFAPSYSHTAPGATSVEWRNNGNGTFTAVQNSTGYGLYSHNGTAFASFGSMPRDYDGDGDVDFVEILTHGYGDGASGVHSTTVTNNGGVWSWDFFRVTGRAADDNDLGHHGDHYASWLDFDNDGLPDFAITECCYLAPDGSENNRIYLFKQNPDHTFSNVTSSSGLGAVNALGARVHNVTPLDYDRDGDEDLLIGFADGTPVQLWRNDLGTANHWITLNLEGAGGAGRANRSAIGARVELTAGGVTQTREVYAGNGQFGPQSPLSLSFGLGSASVVSSIRVRWPNADQSVTQLTNVPANQFLTIREQPADASCTIDLTTNTNTCAGIGAISFVVPPAGGRTVLKLNLDPRGSGFTKAAFDVQYASIPTGFTVNIGDSASDNGYGGDAAQQSNDAEMQVTDASMYVYGKDGTPSQPLVAVNSFASSGSLLTFEVNNRRLTWDNHAGIASALASPYLYALNGQPDTEGPVNYDIYAAFNRVISTTTRSGTGVTRVTVRLSAEPPTCKVDLVNNTHTCNGIEAIQFPAPPAGGRTVLKLNLDRNDSGFRKAVFDVAYGTNPTGWTVNIGDSDTNDGFGGDYATQSNDAELEVQNGMFSIYGKDGTPSQPLFRTTGFEDDFTFATFEISDQKVVYDNHDGIASSLTSPYLYALNGQPDAEGPVNYDLFAAFNRVIAGSYRSGTGVREVTIKLLP